MALFYISVFNQERYVSFQRKLLENQVHHSVYTCFHIFNTFMASKIQLKTEKTSRALCLHNTSFSGWH